MPTKSDPLREKALEFGVRIVNACRYLQEVKRERIMSKQLLRSGINPGAMVREAVYGESGADFIHKLAIAQKEMAETIYWLELLHSTEYLTEKEFESLQQDAIEIIKIITQSIKTRKKNLRDTGH